MIENQPYPKTFRTKTGYCEITPEAIRIVRRGTRGNLAEMTMGNNIVAPLIMYGLIAVYVGYKSVEFYQNGNTPIALLFAALTLYFAIGTITSIRNSGAPVIKRSSIREVKLVKGATGVSRSRFEVWFVNEKGETKKRLIMLPGLTGGGETETAKAIEILRKEGLMK
ncbi:MAG: phosphoribosylaminoimidazolesuccinocarboxamide synthase [Flavobacteriia bacterium]|nr:phosphoribosylaminoimidazolesuccinocarboxamide synthase [Flavobacteriia bacterium]